MSKRRNNIIRLKRTKGQKKMARESELDRIRAELETLGDQRPAPDEPLPVGLLS